MVLICAQTNAHHANQNKHYTIYGEWLCSLCDNWGKSRWWWWGEVEKVVENCKMVFVGPIEQIFIEECALHVEMMATVKLESV